MERVVRDVLQGVLEVIVLVKGHGGVWRGHSDAWREIEEEGDGSSQQDSQQQQPPAEDLRLWKPEKKNNNNDDDDQTRDIAQRQRKADAHTRRRGGICHSSKGGRSLVFFVFLVFLYFILEI